MKKILLVLSTLVFVSNSICLAYDAGTSTSDASLPQAHEFAYENGITTVQGLNWFRPELSVTREQAAKMFVAFARTYIGEDYFYRPDTGLNCVFNDRAEFSKELKMYIYESCRFGIFKGSNGYFNAKGHLTHDQATTLINRITGIIVVGTGNTSPNNNFISRGEIIKLMYESYRGLNKAI